MFFKNMEQVSIEVDEEAGNIRINQENSARQEDETIIITTHQIDGLIGWLQEAKDYLSKVNSKD